jgi:hypothetical protein
MSPATGNAVTGSGPPVKHGLDVVPIGVEDVRGVVGRVVLRAQRRRPVVASACRQRRVVEGLDGLPVVRGEGDVDRSAGFPRPDPEILASFGAETVGP